MNRKIFRLVLMSFFLAIQGIWAGFCADYNYSASECNSDPVKCAKQYYIFINDHKYRDAYNLRSEKANKEVPYERWIINWHNNRSIGFFGNMETKEKSANKVVLRYTAGSEDLLPNKKIQYGNYTITATLIKSNAGWRIDKFDVKTDHTETGEIFEKVLDNVKPEKLFEGVPVYPGFNMKDPVVISDVSDKKGFSVMKASARVRGLDPEKVFRYYESKLKPLGWTTMGPAGGSSNIGGLFKKKNMEVYISVRTATWDGTEAPIDPRGTLLIIKYRTVK
ncbi:MAG: hypothetical protein LWY06_13480 [Firmicutes bacterium]|nr:hypothetical protein [Bacillota bacterium]